MNVEIQANQCREDKVHSFPVQDFSVQLAVLEKNKYINNILKGSYSYSQILFPTHPYHLSQQLFQ